MNRKGRSTNRQIGKQTKSIVCWPASPDFVQSCLTLTSVIWKPHAGLFYQRIMNRWFTLPPRASDTLPHPPTLTESFNYSGICDGFYSAKSFMSFRFNPRILVSCCNKFSWPLKRVTHLFINVRSNSLFTLILFELLFSQIICMESYKHNLHHIAIFDCLVKNGLFSPCTVCYYSRTINA